MLKKHISKLIVPIIILTVILSANSYGRVTEEKVEGKQSFNNQAYEEKIDKVYSKEIKTLENMSVTSLTKDEKEYKKSLERMAKDLKSGDVNTAKNSMEKCLKSLEKLIKDNCN